MASSRQLPLFGLGQIPSKDVSGPRRVPSTPAPVLYASRGYRGGKAAACEGVACLRQAGCNDADAVRSARPQGENAGMGKKEKKAFSRTTPAPGLALRGRESRIRARSTLRRLSPGLCAGRDCRFGKEAALEGVVQLRREGCDEAGMVRSARPKGKKRLKEKEEEGHRFFRTGPDPGSACRPAEAAYARRNRSPGRRIS